MGVGGGGASCPGRFILPPTWVLCLTVFNAHSTCFKLSVNEVVSFIIIIPSQIELFSLLFGLINLCCRGGGQAVQGGLSCPPPRYYI